MTGPLTDVRIIEIASIGPGPFAAMMLADLGADVIRVERLQDDLLVRPTNDPTLRGRRTIRVNIKTTEGVEIILKMAERADGLIEGFRPGVMEAAGIGPDEVHARNPKVVYVRMTGWGQHGPLASTAGHDINYIALAGVLAHLGAADAPPTPPLNLVGDYGGGGMLLVLGMLAGLFEARSSGLGQVVDAAMVDGAALLMAAFQGMRADGNWSDQRGTNLLDGGAPFYRTYETRDGKYVAVGPIERRFHRQLVELAGLPEDLVTARRSVHDWPDQRAAMQAVFLTRTQAEWCDVFAGSDACFAPVLTMAEAAEHPHNKARGTFVSVGGVVQPAPAPRFSRTPTEARPSPNPVGPDPSEILEELGFSSGDIDELRTNKIVQ